MYRSPGDALKYPFITPGSQQYADVLWDWDSWLTNIALRQILLEAGDSEAEKQALHPSLRLRRAGRHFHSIRVGLLERAVAADHEQCLDEWQEDCGHVDHVALLANSAEAKAQVLPELLKGGTFRERGQDVFLELRIDGTIGGVLLAHLTLGIE